MNSIQAGQSIYGPLDETKTQIRLLRIQPATQHDDPIHCTLSTVLLVGTDRHGDESKYEALSYVWGTQDHERPVFIGEQPKRVTVNLYQAIQHLRRTSMERVLWIDALCIDQRNSSERTHQLRTMRTIFEQAESTTIWLGPATEQHFPLAMEWLKRLSSDESLHLDPDFARHAEVEGKHILSPEIIAGCRALFDNAWWSRVWTVQEWILSRHAVFQYGHQVINNLVVQKSYANWKLHETKAGCCYPFVTTNPGWKDTRAYNSPDEAMFSPENLNNINLPYILSSFRKSRNATDPRDRVYGMLGLARSQYENAVVADYTLPVEMAFTTSAIQMISNTGSLEVLSHIVPGARPTMSLPSYVPDWTSSYDDIHAHFSWLKWLKDKDDYNACRRTNADLNTCATNQIRLKGIKVDEIEMISSPLGPALTPGSLDPLLSIVKLHNERNCDDRQIPETVFWSTICGSHKANRFQKSNRRSSWPKGRDPAPFEKLKTWYYKPAGEFIEDHLHDKDIRMFADLYRALRTGRKFVITRKGRVAWCPHFCREGDNIVVLAGGKVPFALRKLETGNYELLGDAYVYGIMDGEAVDELESSDRAWEDITLI